MIPFLGVGSLRPSTRGWKIVSDDSTAVPQPGPCDRALIRTNRYAVIRWRLACQTAALL